MNAKMKTTAIIEIVLKGLAMVVGIPIAFLIEIVRLPIKAATSGWPSLVDEWVSVIEGWRNPSPLLPEGTFIVSEEAVKATV